jgi:D-glycero-alpha-D-manno-heptose 1-phosphate guanylyltransferase
VKAIVLCGGLGTRLGSLTQSTPKPLVAVAGRPFLEYVLDQLAGAQVDEIILAVSFQWEKIHAAIGDRWQDVKVSYSIEQAPLGTGGAIRQAMIQTGLSEALVVNGDTLLKFDVRALTAFAQQCDADVCMTLKYMADTARFGRVDIGPSGRVQAFEEKGGGSAGFINSGVYYVRDAVFAGMANAAFGFENDVLAAKLQALRIYGIQTNAYFIDMGVPEDLARAQAELGNADATISTEKSRH